MNHRHWITLISISIIVLITIIVFQRQRKREEGFVNTIFKNELGQEKCEELWSNDLKPANKVTATSYLNSKRIGKWKGEGAGKGGSCYILDDIQDREQDPLLTVRKCEAIFSEVPFISNVRKMKSEQATTVVQADACVFDIDPKKKNVGDLNKFWEGIAAKDECIQANAYIIAIFEQLTKEKLDALSLLASLKAENARLAGAKTKLLSDISVLGANIVTSNVIYNDLIVKNGVYTNELIKLRNDFGQNKTDYFNKSNVCVAYLKSCNVFVQQLTTASQSLDYQIADSVQKYNEQRTLYDNLRNEYNSYVTSKEKLDSDLTVLVGENERNKKDYQQVVTDLRVCRGALEGVDRQVASLSAEFDDYTKRNAVVLESLGKCKVFLADCQSKSAVCADVCRRLTSSIVDYNKKIAEQNKLISQCGARNAALVQTMSNMNVYFDWVRSVYIYLSCDGFDLTLKKNQQSLDLLQTQCKDADTYIANAVTRVENTYIASQSNAKSDLQMCETEVTSIRDDINNKIFKDSVYITGDIRLACGTSEICPARNEAEANKIAQDTCSATIPGSYYTGKWYNYDGQRGAVACSYYGKTEQSAKASASSKVIQRNVGNVLPAGTYSNILKGCTAKNYMLSCPNVPNFSFENCASNVNYFADGNRLSCRPDGYEYPVTSIAICDFGTTCTFSNPKKDTTQDMNELMDICKKYIKPLDVANTLTNVAVFYTNEKDAILIKSTNGITQGAYFNITRMAVKGTAIKGTTIDNKTLQVSNATTVTVVTTTSKMYGFYMLPYFSGGMILVDGNSPLFNAIPYGKRFTISATDGKVESRSKPLLSNGPRTAVYINNVQLPIFIAIPNGFLICTDMLQNNDSAKSLLAFVTKYKECNLFISIGSSKDVQLKVKNTSNIADFITFYSNLFNVTNRQAARANLTLIIENSLTNQVKKQNIRPIDLKNIYTNSNYTFVYCDISDKKLLSNMMTTISSNTIQYNGLSSIKFAEEKDVSSGSFSVSQRVYLDTYPTNPIYWFGYNGDFMCNWQWKSLKVSITTPENLNMPASKIPDIEGTQEYTMVTYTPQIKISATEIDIVVKKQRPLPDLIPTGDTISLNDGRKGAYCTYWGLSNDQATVNPYNCSIEAGAKVITIR